MPREPLRVAIVGRGKVGRAIYRALSTSTIEAHLIAARSLSTKKTAPTSVASADVLYLCVPDPAIRPTAETLARFDLRPNLVALHAAGARNETELMPLASRASLGTLHPLSSFADDSPSRPDIAASATTFVISGQPRAVSRARAIARGCRARVVHVSALDRRLYHAAAALAANGTVALADHALALLVRAGLPERDALAALSGLLASVVDNIARLGPTQALTGPASRGDADTILAHTQALDRDAPESAQLYRDVTRAIVHVARGRGLSDAGAAHVLSIAEPREAPRKPRAP